jgi:hypothetical protein
MKKASFIFFILLHTICLKAQINTSNIYNTWVKVKTTYNDGGELPNVLIQKYSYTKYKLSNSGIINITIKYSGKGSDNKFFVIDSVLSVTSLDNNPVNELRVVKLTADEMVLSQKGATGADEASAFRFYFIPESVFQKKSKFAADEISTLATGDTVYQESPKVYAEFKGEESFQSFLSDRSEGTNMDGQEGYFKASFIVLKSGMVDSVKILNSINSDYDKQYIKWFNKNKKNWLPAMLNGKPVNIKRIEEIRYFTSARTQPVMRFNNNAYAALTEGNYEKALYYYNQALTYMPDNTEDMYKRAACKIALGITDGLCNDLIKVKATGTLLMDELVDKYCPASKN